MTMEAGQRGLAHAEPLGTPEIRLRHSGSGGTKKKELSIHEREGGTVTIIRTWTLIGFMGDPGTDDEA